MVYWLILVISGGVTAQGASGIPSNPQAMHVGNFPSLAACEAAAREAKLIPVRQNGLLVVGGFICVRAQGEGVNAPAN
ncbi:MAG: hypothetical protein F9K29_23925 [Hyphomicrobiaceae bacterium]|nr:MAG: hypothetical protein F9K29_23925 [Hyphomicrobiaceae bacterium]